MTHTAILPAGIARGRAALPADRAMADSRADQQASEHVADTLRLLSEQLVPQRRVVHAGDVIYRAGESFGNLYVLNSGFVKIVKLAADGREQVVSLKLRSDWLGFDGIASGAYGCDAVAMDTGDVWMIAYDKLIETSVACPALLSVLHEAMSREIGRDRESLMAVCTLPANARVAEFLRRWADALSKRGLRSDEIALRMTRAEIGNYLGMTLETVSRAMSRLARDKVIAFAETGRRDLRIADADALACFVQRCLSPAAVLQ